ncbi:nuclear transport factor 2 family protein [Pseudonocardia adelaidensis]
MAPTVPRPSEHAEEAAETRAATPAPEHPAEAPPAGKGKPKRPRPKADPGVDGTERLPVVDDEKPAKPAGRARKKPARSTVEPADPEVDGTERLPVVDDEKPVEPASTRKKRAPRRAEAATEAADDGVDNDTGAAPEAGRGARMVALVRRRAVPLLAVAAVLLAGVAVFAGIQDARLRGTPAAQNTALVDVGTTAEVAGQLSDAVETVYSFDFTRLDENENAARNVITPEFAAEFDRLFGEVRARAPEQQAVVSATVTHTAVKEITGDRAVVVAFVDQQATRAAPDAQSQQLAAAGRLTVTGERVDGRWKIAAVTPL